MSSASDFIVENGVLTKYIGPGGDVIIPVGVTSIGLGAFYKCNSLTSIAIPKGVTSIETIAFRYCSSLTRVTIPEGVINIGNWVFADCSNLKSVAIPESVTNISNSAFYNCSNLTTVTIPESVKSIGKEAFFGCNSLTRVTIPGSVTSISKDAFRECGHLCIILPDSLQIVEPAFGKCVCRVKTQRWSSVITTLLRNTTLEAVDVEEFRSLPAALRLSKSLQLIADTTFDWASTCGKDCLDYLTKSTAKLCAAAFDHPELLHFFCDHSLIEAKDLDTFLEEAEKRNNVESKALLLNYQNTLGDDVLLKVREEKDKKKEDYTDALIERIAARDPSKGITGMTFVITGKLSDVWGSRKEAQTYLEGYGAKLGSSITKKTDYLVTNNMDTNSEKNRKAKEFGAQIITEDEFNEMIGKRFKDAPQLSVPTWIRDIPPKAFSNCSSMTSVIIPDTVTSIGENAFMGCSSLNAVHISSMNAWCNIVFFRPSPYYRSYSNPLSYAHKLYLNGELVTDLVIPEGITSIGSGTFESCTSLTSVTLPKSVTSIGDTAFYGCRNMEKLTILGRLNSVGMRVLYNCGNINYDCTYSKSFSLLTENNWIIENGVLKQYNGPGGDLVIPENVTSIGSSVFWGCSALTSVTVPEGVTSIGANAFYQCRDMTSITLPESLTMIFSDAFEDCSSLRNVTIPESVVLIGYKAFGGCTSLTDVTIPESATDIRFNAFEGCPKLTIHAPTGSYAEQLAREYNILFEAK